MNLCMHRQTETLFVPDFANLLSLDFRQTFEKTDEREVAEVDQEIKASQLTLFIQERGQGTDKC